MGFTMWNFPVPLFLNENYTAIGIIQLILATFILVINKSFFVSGFKSILHGNPNMDTLVALGASASYIWSVYALFMMTDAQLKGGIGSAREWIYELYFESASMIVTLITVGKMLEARSKGKTTNAIKSYLKHLRHMIWKENILQL